jgi:DNA segregation ATPase FtsK/SpoIIIE-like protein
MIQCSNCDELRKDLDAIRSGLSEILSLLSGEQAARPAAEVSPQPAEQARADFLKQIVASSELPEDETLFEKVLILITDMGYASTMVLQHKLEMSYRQAADVIAEMERSGLIGPAHGFRPHKVMPSAYAIRSRIEEDSKRCVWQDAHDERAKQKALFESRRS